MKCDHKYAGKLNLEYSDHIWWKANSPFLPYKTCRILFIITHGHPYLFQIKILSVSHSMGLVLLDLIIRGDWWNVKFAKLQSSDYYSWQMWIPEPIKYSIFFTHHYDTITFHYLKHVNWTRCIYLNWKWTWNVHFQIYYIYQIIWIRIQMRMYVWHYHATFAPTLDGHIGSD